MKFCSSSGFSNSCLISSPIAWQYSMSSFSVAGSLAISVTVSAVVSVLVVVSVVVVLSASSVSGGIVFVSVVFVIVFSNLITSLIRDLIPNRVRIIVQLGIIATLVTLVSEVLKAYNYEMFKVLGAFTFSGK